MNYAYERLPLEHSPREALRIYGNRLLIFTGMMAANILFFVIIKFAISEPIIFCFCLVFCGAFVFVCWWVSREFVLARAYKIYNKTPENLASDTEAITAAMIAISALVGLETEEAKATLSENRFIKLEKEITVREFLEISMSFQHYLINEFIGTLAEKYATRRKKDEWIQLAETVGKIYQRIHSLLDTMNEKEQDINIILSLDDKIPEKLNIHLLLSYYIDEIKTFQKPINKKDSVKTSIIVRRYIVLSPHLWDAMLGTELISTHLKEIKSIKKLLVQQRGELINISKYL